MKSLSLTKLSVLHSLKTALAWLKGNWFLIIVLAGAIAALISSQDKTKGLENLLAAFQRQQAINAAELANLQKIQQDQVAKQQEIDRKYQEVISKIEHDFQNQLQNLNDQKQAQLRAIITANADNPDAMAIQINSLLGIPLYPPQTSGVPSVDPQVHPLSGVST